MLPIFRPGLGPCASAIMVCCNPLRTGSNYFLKRFSCLRAPIVSSFSWPLYFQPAQSFLVMTILPFDHHLQVADPAGGIIYVIGISGLSTLGISTGRLGL